MDRSKAKLVGDKIMDALKTIEDELGVTFTRGNGRFDSDSISFKITAMDRGENGEVQTPEAKDFVYYAVSFGLKADDLGRTFRQGGETFTITGMKPRSRKYPVLATSASGKTYKFGADSVKAMLTLAG
jgi:hypothetical protein